MPIDREELIQRLMATFLDELEEHARSLNRDLLALEKADEPDARAETLRTLFRTAHSLKGAARSVHVEAIETACHKLEGIIADVRDGRLTLHADLFQLLFATVDAIEEAGTCLREKRPLSDTALEGLLPRLDAARTPGELPAPVGVGPRAMPAAPAAHDPQTSGSPEVEAHPAVRIQAAKLDALLAASRELFVAGRRLEPRTEELEALLQFVARWREDWRKAVRPLRTALGLGPERSSGPKRGSSGQAVSRNAARALDQVSENVDRAARSLDALLSQLGSDHRAIERAARSLEGEVRRVRMIPFADGCEGLERAARDIAKAAGKEVELVLEGREIELDRSVLATLKDPLMHLVRNAVDHGLEASSEREAAGKPARGRVEVAAALHGERVRITVTDDGSGLDLDAVREAAARRNLPPPADADEAARLIFEPGFSTTRSITEVSGRGVGLDVVRGAVEVLHGTVTCHADPAGGLSVVLDLPLTLTTIRAVLISVAGHTHAVPQSHVQGLVRIGADDVRSVEGREVILQGGSPVPLVSMADVLGLPVRETPRASAKIPVVVIQMAEGRAAFSVDELLAEQDLVVTNLGRRLRRVPYVSGAALLPSGRIALILNPMDLLRSALQEASRRPLVQDVAAATTQAKQLLVVDDSVTTRSLVKSILEAAGYTVLTAADGAAAWQLLQERGADLVVADVEMPRMDGCDLAKTIRRSLRFRKLPVVLVTALDSPEHRERGMESGADAYLVKSAFDQKQLLETIAQLL